MAIVETGTGKTIQLKVEASDTIHGVKQKIQEIKGYLSDRHVLVYHGSQVEDGRTLALCKVLNGSVYSLPPASFKSVYFTTCRREFAIIVR